MQGDFNQDGVLDIADALAIKNYDGDWDDDGVADPLDAYPFDPERYEETEDEVPDAMKLDVNGDGYADSLNRYRIDDAADMDSDGILNATDTDDDGDQISDLNEDQGWTNTAQPPYHSGGPFVTDSLLADTDRDGLNDYQEKIRNTNPLDADTDGDGYVDGSEVAAGTNPLNPSPPHPSKKRDLTPTQVRLNKQFQAKQEQHRAAKSEDGESGRALGFQGPEAIGAGFESVQSDQFSGTFSYSIPIKVPPGRNGMQPNLSLVYRSTNGHSWVGQGWDLNPGRIERSTKDGVPKYNSASNPPDSDEDPMTPLDNPDTYIYTTSAGGNQLVYTGTDNSPTSPTYGCGIYHADVDSGSFVRFIHHPDPKPVNAGGGWWEVWMKDGRKAYFGGKGAFDKSACLYDLAHFNDAAGEFSSGWGVFHWGLVREEDSTVDGNAIVYEYVKLSIENNMYLSNISYNYDGITAMASIAFTIEERDVDKPWASYRESYRSKAKIISDFFLRYIDESVAGRPSPRIRKYELTYWPLDVPKGRTISCLKSVKEFGETDADSFPAISLAYSESGGGWDTYDTSRYSPYLPVGYITQVFGIDYGVRLYDFDGDALTDYTGRCFFRPGNETYRTLLRNTGEGWGSADVRWDPPEHFSAVNEELWRTYSYGDFIADIDGDGLTDLAWSVTGPWWDSGLDYRALAFNRGNDPTRTGECAAWEWRTSDPYILPCNIGYAWTKKTWGVRAAELNGDGLVDIVQSFLTEPSTITSANWLNTGSGWTNGSSGFNLAYGIDYQYSSDPTKFNGGIVIELNGDGLTDFTINNPYLGAYSINTGIAWENYTSGPYMCPWTIAFPQWSDDYGVRSIDLNGDGLEDMIRSTSGGSYGPDRGVVLNNGAGWVTGSDSLVPMAFTYYEGTTVFNTGSAFGDLDGDGFIDIIYSAADYSGWPYRKVMFNLASAANLLTDIDNGIGGRVEVEYTPQTRGFMKLYDPITDQTEVNERVPYVVRVVSKITKTGEWPVDSGGKESQSYTKLYRYAGGKHLDREFRGFGKVKEIDAQTGNFTITEFFQDYARKGQVQSQRSYVGDRRDYRTDGTINGPIQSPADEAEPAHEPKLSSEIHYRYRVVVHADDKNHLKTFTNTHAELNLGNDFPLGVTLVTPACVLTRKYEYIGSNYANTPSSSIVISQESYYDGRGNLVQTMDYGQVATRVAGATFQQLEDPRIDVTFTDTTGLDPDGQRGQMTQYLRMGNWTDFPVKTNTSGCFTDRNTGNRVKDSGKILKAQVTEYDPATYLPIRKTASLDTGPDPVTEYVHDDYGNVTTITKPRGNQTHLTYESTYHVFPETKTDALGHVESFVFDPGFGVLLRHTDVNNRMSTAQYDALGRITVRNNTAGAPVTSYEYGFLDDQGDGTYAPNRVRTITHISSTGQTWSEEHYDGLGRVYEKLSVGQRGESDPVRVATLYNDREQAWKTSLPHWSTDANTPGAVHWKSIFLENDDPAASTGQWAKMGLNRTVKTRTELNASDTAETSIEYETPLSQKSVDSLGHERRTIKDAFGNYTDVWEPNADTGSVGGAYPDCEGRVTKYGYDATGNLEYIRRYVSLDLPSDQDIITNIWYDTLSQKVHLDDPDTGQTLYEYDANGNMIRSVDARGLVVVCKFDMLNRMIRMIFPDSAGAGLQTYEYAYDAYAYDPGQPGTNLVGKLAQVVTPACMVSYSYDAEGRTLWERRKIDDVTYVTATTYDRAGRETTKTYPDGIQLVYTYDPVSQNLNHITRNPSGVLLEDSQTSEFGSIKTMLLGNGVSRTRAFDYSGRAISQQIKKGTQFLSNISYAFDRSSNITEIRELTGTAPFGHMYYGYDAFDHLLKAWGTTMSGQDAGDAMNPGYEYRYDGLGRMTHNSRFSNDGYSGYDVEYLYSENPSLDRPAQAVRGIRFTKEGYPPISAHEFSYDAAGNLDHSSNGPAAILPQNDLARQFTWDALGRVTSVTANSQTTHFVYDHEGKRVKKSGTSGTVTYLGIIAELTSDGYTDHVFANGERIATIRPDGSTLFYMTDHLSSSTLITDTNGDPAQRMDYEPYGALLVNDRSSNDLELRHTYTGQEADAETGLMYYKARYYDPMVGMFVSADSFVDSMQPVNSPRQFNKYAYANNNPMRFSDPTGQWPKVFEDIAGWIGEKAEDVGQKTEQAFSWLNQNAFSPAIEWGQQKLVDVKHWAIVQGGEFIDEITRPSKPYEKKSSAGNRGKREPQWERYDKSKGNYCDKTDRDPRTGEEVQYFIYYDPETQDMQVEVYVVERSIFDNRITGLDYRYTETYTPGDGDNGNFCPREHYRFAGNVYGNNHYVDWDSGWSVSGH